MMVRLHLSCGCKMIAAYPGRTRWMDLHKEQQAAIKQRAIAKHKCPKVQPPPSTEPQKP